MSEFKPRSEVLYLALYNQKMDLFQSRTLLFEGFVEDCSLQYPEVYVVCVDGHPLDHHIGYYSSFDKAVAQIRSCTFIRTIPACRMTLSNWLRLDEPVAEC